MKRLAFAVAFVVAATGPAQATRATAGDEQSEEFARSVLEKADEIRFPKTGFEVEIVVRSKMGDEALEPRVYKVLSKGNEKTVIQTLEPATERGQNMLMRERDLWVYLPNVSQPVRLSLSQRLTGQVANGDLARANFSGDYTPKLLRTEKVGKDDHYVLELTASERGVTYQKVLYWVRKSNHFPHKAEFYSLSGRLLKTCVYEEFKTLGGKVRPTRLTMTDALKEGDVSVMEYSAMKTRDLPDRMFTKEYMKRLD